MSHTPTRLLVAFALIALVFLSSTHATALPQATTLRSAAERADATPGFFARIWDLLSAWMIGSILDPNGAGTNAGPGTGPDAAGVGDIGSGLEPNG